MSASPLASASPSLDLSRAAKAELDFLSLVDRHGDVLYDLEVLRLSACRYERLWMPLLQRTGIDNPPKPPVDIAFVWHCHALCPTRYVYTAQSLRR